MICYRKVCYNGGYLNINCRKSDDMTRNTVENETYDKLNNMTNGENALLLGSVNPYSPLAYYDNDFLIQVQNESNNITESENRKLLDRNHKAKYGIENEIVTMACQSQQNNDNFEEIK